MNWLKNENGFVYLDLDFIETEKTPRNPYVTGYGKKIPTSYKVIHGNKLYRVYCAQFSNAGSCYIKMMTKNVLVRLKDRIPIENLRNYRN